MATPQQSARRELRRGSSYVGVVDLSSSSETGEADSPDTPRAVTATTGLATNGAALPAHQPKTAAALSAAASALAADAAPVTDVRRSPVATPAAPAAVKQHDGSPTVPQRSPRPPMGAAAAGAKQSSDAAVTVTAAAVPPKGESSATASAATPSSTATLSPTAAPIVSVAAAAAKPKLPSPRVAPLSLAALTSATSPPSSGADVVANGDSAAAAAATLDDDGDVSESVDPGLLGRGFASGSESDNDPLDDEPDRPAGGDENYMESEDWADQELRELRSFIASGANPQKMDRRRTLNGVDVAPRSELSPPVVVDESKPVSQPLVDPFSGDGGAKKKSLSLKFKTHHSQSSASEAPNNSISAASELSRSSTLSRLSSKLKRKSHRTAAEALQGGPAPPPVTQMTRRVSATTILAGPALLQSGTATELIRYVVDKALDSDEQAFHSYVLTLAYYTDPVRVLSDLVTELDVASAVTAAKEAAADSDGSSDEGTTAGLPNSERALRIIMYWVTQLWPQFESNAALHLVLTHFLDHSRATRATARLRDCVAAQCASRDALRAALAALSARPAATPAARPAADDVMAELVCDEEPAVDEPEELVEAPVEDVTATFVGAETYNERSRPMGLAALMEGDSDDNNNNNSAAAAAADGVAGSALTASGRVAIRRAKSSVLAPASAAAAPSRPMGLFGLLEPHHEQSLWDRCAAGQLDAPVLRLASGGAVSAAHTASDVARQLTLLECAHWRMVSPLELQRAMWKHDSDDAGANLRQVIAWHNRIAAWVQWELLRHRALRDRVMALQRFVSVALCLERMQNYHTLFGVLAGAQVHTVARLALHEELPAQWRRAYERLAALASTRHNWQAYRAVKARATHFPFYPFVGVYLQDLQVCEAKEKTFVDGEEGAEKIVNFAKMRKLGALLKEILFVQRGSEYRFEQHPRVLAYLMSFQTPSESELWEMSLALKPVAAEAEQTERASAKAFLASAISPRGREMAEEGRGRSGSITGALQRWGRVDDDSSPMVRARHAAHSAGAGTTTPPSRSTGSHSPRSPRSAQPSPRRSDVKMSPRPAPPAAAPGHTGGATTANASPPAAAGADDTFRCPLCVAAYRSLRALHEHVSKRQCSGSLRQHACPVCECAFAAKDELLSHLALRTCVKPVGPIACPLCDAKFASNEQMRTHVHKRDCL